MQMHRNLVLDAARVTEAAAIRVAFDHPNAANYEAIALNPKQKIRRADGLAAGVHGFVEWRAFKRLIGKT